MELYWQVSRVTDEVPVPGEDVNPQPGGEGANEKIRCRADYAQRPEPIEEPCGRLIVAYPRRHIGQGRECRSNPFELHLRPHATEYFLANRSAEQRVAGHGQSFDFRANGEVNV